MEVQIPELLVVLIDMNGGNWDLSKLYMELSFQDVIECLCVLLNVHMLPEHRRLTVFATDETRPRLVYEPPSDIAPSPKEIMDGVFDGLSSSPPSTHRHSMSKALMGCLMHINSLRLPARVFLLRGPLELNPVDASESLQISFQMGKRGIMLDILDINRPDKISNTLAYVSGGTYYCLKDAQCSGKVSERAWLQTALLRYFSVPIGQRRVFVTPPIKSIEYMPVCSVPGCPCNNRYVSIGFVCSRCLAVMCGVQPRCWQCGARLRACDHGPNRVLSSMMAPSE